MEFWTQERIKEALCDCSFHNFSEDWTSDGLRIWHDDFGKNCMVLVRREGEKRGVLLTKLPELLNKISAIVTTNAKEFEKYKKPVIEVEFDTGDMILMLAKYIRKFFKGKVIDVTGSSGKSTTTRMIYDILKSEGASCNLSQSNTSWGISWNMTNFNLDDKYWVIETSLGGGIARNSKITQPDYSIITNIAPVHLRNDQTLADIAKEKSKVFTAMNEGAYAILYKEMAHYDIVFAEAKAKNLNIITFGEGDCDIKIHSGDENWFEIFGKRYDFLNTPTQKHLMLDMGAALAVAYLENLDIEKSIEILKEFESLSGRGEKFSGCIGFNKEITVVDESYNANPLSMKSALEGFKKITGGKSSVLILGDMSEGGAKTFEQHTGLEKTIREVNPSKILFCGKEIKALWDLLKSDYSGEHYETVEELNKDLTLWLENGDNVFVKASHSVGLFKTVNVLKAFMKKYTKGE